MAVRDWFRKSVELTLEPPPPVAPGYSLADGGQSSSLAGEMPRISALAEVGATGLKRMGGYIYEEILRELQGTRSIRAFKEMRENDPIVGAFIYAIEMLIRSVTWDVKAASGSSDDLRRRDFLKENMDDMSTTWTETIVENLSMIPYGFSWHEAVYKLRNGDNPPRFAGSLEDPPKSRFKDGLVGWRKLPIRAQDSLLRWEFQPAGSVAAMLQQPPPDYQLRRIPIEKSLLFRTTQHKNDPQGRSVLRNAYVPYYFKKAIQRYEAIGVERDLAGLPVLEVPPRMLSPKATPEEKALLAEYQKIVTNVRRDEQEGLILPREFDEKGNERYKFSLLSTGGRRQFDTSGIIGRYNQEMAVTVLADFILVGHGSQGSGGGKGGTALVKNKTEIFALAISSFLDSIADVYNRYEVPRLFRLNGEPVDSLPSLTHGAIEEVDLTELGAYIANLAGAGMPLFPDDKLENKLRSDAGLPEKSETGQDVGSDAEAGGPSDDDPGDSVGLNP